MNDIADMKIEDIQSAIVGMTEENMRSFLMGMQYARLIADQRYNGYVSHQYEDDPGAATGWNYAVSNISDDIGSSMSTFIDQ